MTTSRRKTVLYLLCSTLFTVAQLATGCSPANNGEKLFFSEGCSQCHTFNGRGGRMGPDLSGIANIRSESWIDSYIQAPKKMNPSARMPSFSHLSSSKRKAIIAFLKN